MKKILAFVMALGISAAATANQVVDQQSALVDGVNCVQIAQNESMVGGMVGGAVGSVGGALVGSLFGKTGKSIGAIAGGLGGAAYGASGSKVYNCTVMARLSNNEKIMVTKQTGQPIQQGDTLGVVKLSNGFWQAI